MVKSYTSFGSILTIENQNIELSFFTVNKKMEAALRIPSIISLYYAIFFHAPLFSSFPRILFLIRDKPENSFCVNFKVFGEKKDIPYTIFITVFINPFIYSPISISLLLYRKLFVYACLNNQDAGLYPGGGRLI